MNKNFTFAACLPFQCWVWLLLLNCHGVHAQSDYRPGYVVTGTSDTLPGWISDRSEGGNARRCYYRPSLHADPVKYEAGEVAGYGFNEGKRYESRQVRLDSSAKAAYFLELLVKGRISLFHLNLGERFYVEKPPEDPYELVVTRQRIERDGQPYLQVQERYKGILSYLMRDCPALRRKIEGMSLEYYTLSNLVEQYNTCQNAPSQVHKAKLITLKAGLVAGLQQTRLHFTSNGRLPGYDYLTKASFSVSRSPMAGLYLQSTLPWVTKRITLRLEAQYSQDRYLSYRQYTTVDDTWREDVSIRHRYLHFPLLLRYTYPRGKLRPFLQAGARMDVSLRQSSNFIQEKEFFRSISSREEPAVRMAQTQVGSLIGVGMEHSFAKHWRCFAELRGSLGRGFVDVSAQTPYAARTTSWTLQVGVGF